MIRVNSAKIAMFGYKYNLTLEELANYFKLTIEELNTNAFSKNNKFDINIIKKIANKMDLKLKDLIIDN